MIEKVGDREWKKGKVKRMKSVNSIEKKKLVFYRNLIDSLLSLEEYIEGKDEEISDMLLQRIEQLYERMDKEMGKTLSELGMTVILEDMLGLVQNAQGGQSKYGTQREWAEPEVQQMIPPISYYEDNSHGETELFEPECKPVMENTFAETCLLHAPMRLPYLIRKSTKEKILINRDVFKIGKEKSYVDYYVENDAVSRTHADIVRKKDHFYVVDQDSLNHTFLEGKRLPAKKYVKIKSGQSFVLADEEFTFYYEAI